MNFKEIKTNDEFCPVNDYLEKELQEMEERRPKRDDPKFTILKRFVERLANESFVDIFESLKSEEKHAIITRLENQYYTSKDENLCEIIKELSESLYGDPEKPDSFTRKVELEKLLQ